MQAKEHEKEQKVKQEEEHAKKKSALCKFPFLIKLRKTAKNILLIKKMPFFAVFFQKKFRNGWDGFKRNGGFGNCLTLRVLYLTSALDGPNQRTAFSLSMPRLRDTYN